MSTVGGGEELKALADEMSGSLERRISDLLGHVKAAKEVTQQLVELDAELGRQRGVKLRLSGIVDSMGDDADPETSDLRRRLDTVTRRVAKLESRRSVLFERLVTLKRALDV